MLIIRDWGITKLRTKLEDLLPGVEVRMGRSGEIMVVWEENCSDFEIR